ncbi:MAG: hypothetical protein QOC62_6024 [Mycobacterium sp.]|jgi:hypothetical protein|nr:hypothetical protein [Mycobacterium sp.]
MAEELKPPAGLAAGGRALWRQIVRAAAEEDQELSALEQRHLLSAAQLTDMADELRAAMAGEAKVVPGYMSQPTAHPLLNEWRQLTGLVAQTLARIKFLPPEEDVSAGKPPRRSTAARAAANVGWRGPS